MCPFIVGEVGSIRSFSHATKRTKSPILYPFQTVSKALQCNVGDRVEVSFAGWINGVRSDAWASDRTG